MIVENDKVQSELIEALNNWTALELCQLNYDREYAGHFLYFSDDSYCCRW